MNNRDYKDFAPNEFFHVYNRGVGKMDIFLDEEDHRIFLDRLKENLFPDSIKKSGKPRLSPRRKLLPANSFNLLSYCLMPNHFHLLIHQNSDLNITHLVSKVCTSYSKYFNKKYDRVGSVFQDKFKAVRISKNEQLLWTSFYIHNNPKKGGLVEGLSKYKWSSYLDYSSLESYGLCDKSFILEQFNSPKSYLKYFDDPVLEKEMENNLLSQLDLFIDFE